MLVYTPHVRWVLTDWGRGATRNPVPIMFRVGPETVQALANGEIDVKWPSGEIAGWGDEGRVDKRGVGAARRRP